MLLVRRGGSMAMSQHETKDQEAYELQRMSHIIPLANMMLAACRFNGLDCAAGLVTLAQVLAGNDKVNRISLAQIMIDAARQLDPDVVNAPLALQ
jgi:hypothetical protein